MSEHVGFLFVFAALVAASVVGMILLLRHEKRLAAIWESKAEGAFDRAEYGYYDEPRRSGSMVHTTSYHRMTVTAVYFTDGRSFVIGGRRDLPFTKGTRIRILRNRLGGHRIVGCGAAPSLTVLYTARIGDLLAFYRAVGLEFVAERHGTGPDHFACDLGTMVVEIYPANAAGDAPSPRGGGSTRLGFSVASLDEALAALSALGRSSVGPPANGGSGRRAVVNDPDGRPVELTERA